MEKVQNPSNSVSEPFRIYLGGKCPTFLKLAAVSCSFINYQWKKKVKALTGIDSVLANDNSEDRNAFS
jgi:hypothetical protein